MALSIAISLAIFVVWSLSLSAFWVGFVFAVPGDGKGTAGLTAIRWLMPTLALAMTMLTIYVLHWIWT